jgi:hypothetical protein
MLAVAATCLVAALVAAPTAGAAASSGAPKAQSAQSKKKLARDIRTIRSRSNRNRRNIIKLNSDLSKLGSDLRAAITGGDKTIDDKINGIVGVVTPVLQRLGDAALALEAGLKTLAAETTKGFDQVKAGFTTVEGAIKTVATSQEYGVVRVAAGPNVVPGLPAITSPDIPDDGNAAIASGELPFQLGANPGQLPGGTPLSLRAAIRSGEAGDGDATGDPAGQTAGFLMLTCAAADGQCDLDPTAGSQPVASGAVVCTVGPPPPNFAYTPPGGTATTLPVVNIQEADARTDQTAPGSGDTNPVSGGGAAPATGTGNGGNGSCSVGDATGNDTYVLKAQVQFLDLPTSASPDADD